MEGIYTLNLLNEIKVTLKNIIDILASVPIPMVVLIHCQRNKKPMVKSGDLCAV